MPAALLFKTSATSETSRCWRRASPSFRQSDIPLCPLIPAAGALFLPPPASFSPWQPASPRRIHIEHSRLAVDDRHLSVPSFLDIHGHKSLDVHAAGQDRRVEFGEPCSVINPSSMSFSNCTVSLGPGPPPSGSLAGSGSPTPPRHRRVSLQGGS